MLGVGVKSATHLDVGTFISQYVNDNYTDDKNSAATRDSMAEQKVTILSACRALNQQRLDLLAAIDNKSERPAYHKAFITYLGAIYAASQRFPFGEDGRTGLFGHKVGKLTTVPAHFKYVDAFNPSRDSSTCDPRYEVVSQIFNYAAFLSREALRVRNTPETGLSEACKLFREASGAFAYVANPRFNLSPVVSMDVTAPVALFFADLMIAQAQVCVFEKATQSKFSPEIIAKLAEDAAQKFDAAVRRISAPSPSAGVSAAAVARYFDNCSFKWEANARTLSSFYHASAFYWMGKSKFEAKQWGLEIAYLRVALATNEGTRHYDAGVQEGNPGLAQQRNDLSGSIRSRIGKAEHANETVYFDAVPPTVPPVAAQSMAAFIPFDPIWTEITAAIPAELKAAVGPETRAAADAVTADLGRTASVTAGEARKRTDATRAAIAALGLPSALNAFESALAGGNASSAEASAALIPDDLWARITTHNQRGGVAALRRAGATVDAAANDANTRVSEMKATLASEAAADSEMRRKFGSKWDRLPSAELNSSMTDTISAVESLLSDAARSNASVAAELRDNVDMLKLLELSRAEIAANLPRPRSAAVAAGPAATAAATELREALSEVERVLSEREKRCNALLKASWAAMPPPDAHVAPPGSASGSSSGSGVPATPSGASTASSAHSAAAGPAGETEKGIDVLGRLASAADAGKNRADVVAEIKGEVAKLADAVTELQPQEEAAMEAVRAKNAVFAKCTEGGDDDHELKEALQRIYSAMDVVNKLSANFDEGRRFYAELVRDTLAPLKSRVDDFTMARDIEKRMFSEDLSASAAMGGLSLATSPSGGMAPGGGGPPVVPPRSSGAGSAHGSAGSGVGSGSGHGHGQGHGQGQGQGQGQGYGQGYQQGYGQQQYQQQPPPQNFQQQQYQQPPQQSGYGQQQYSQQYGSNYPPQQQQQQLPPAPQYSQGSYSSYSSNGQQPPQQQQHGGQGYGQQGQGYYNNGGNNGSGGYGW